MRYFPAGMFKRKGEIMKKREIQENIIAAVNRVKAENPMAPSMTNNVTINFVANAQLAVGGAAAMTYLDDEATALAAGTQGFYINMGTMLEAYRDTFVRTARYLHEKKKNLVLDPVGIGLGSVREHILTEMKDCKPAVIRGNASEILTLSSMWGLGAKEKGNVRGVDSTDTVETAENAAIELAGFTGGSVAVSGPVDLITDGHTVVRSEGGSGFMKMITGAGCALGGVTAIYACVTDPFTAAVTAANVFNLAGSRAEKEVDGPGSFQVHFLDNLYKAAAEEIADNPFDVREV